MGVMLIEKTADRWDTGLLTQDELAIIVNNLSLLVPKKVFADYYNLDKSWNQEKLQNIDFMTLITTICSQEAVQDVDWIVFDGNLEPRQAFGLGTTYHHSNRQLSTDVAIQERQVLLT